MEAHVIIVLDRSPRRSLMSRSQPSLVEKHPWTQPWYRADGPNRWVLLYLILLHVLAITGLVLYTWPGWIVFFTAFFFACLGGLGTTLGYHRALAHRAVKLHPVVKHFLIFCGVFNGSGTPTTWVANHRNHHANSDTQDDVSSPRHGGFWWAHFRWLYQWEPSDIKKWAKEIDTPEYKIWHTLQIPLVFVSLTFGYLIGGWAGMLWIGAIRMAWCLHGQCFVNSLLHMKRGLPEGVESSQNIWWLGPLLLAAWGENLHGNHHGDPSSACFSRDRRQVDIAWHIIKGLEKIGLASDVRVHRT